MSDLDVFYISAPIFLSKLVSSLHAKFAKFFRENINMYLHYMSFLHTDMQKIIEILPHIRPGLIYFTVIIMVADVLATQGAKASATMILI